MKDMTYLTAITICLVIAGIALVAAPCITNKKFCKQIDEQTMRLDSLNASIHEAENQQADLDKDIESKRLDLADMSSQKEVLQHDIDCMGADLKRLKADVSIMEGLFEQTKKRTVEAGTELNRLQTEADSILQKNTSLKNILAGVEMAIGDTTLLADPFLGINIVDIGLRPSVVEELNENDVYFIGDLIVEGKEFLKDIPGIGNSTINKIEKILLRHGYTLDSDVIHINRFWFRLRREDSSNEKQQSE